MFQSDEGTRIQEVQQECLSRSATDRSTMEPARPSCHETIPIVSLLGIQIIQRSTLWQIKTPGRDTWMPDRMCKSQGGPRQATTWGPFALGSMSFEAGTRTLVELHCKTVFDSESLSVSLCDVDGKANFRILRHKDFATRPQLRTQPSRLVLFHEETE